MKFNKENYPEYVKKHSEKSKLMPDCIKAFTVGGIICCIGEGLGDIYAFCGMPEQNIKTMIPVTLIFIAAFLTGINVFDKIAEFAGAGTLVPITGFANATVSPALDAKNEGLIIGLGEKIFSVSGAVILYGTLASVIYGIIYYSVKFI